MPAQTHHAEKHKQAEFDLLKAFEIEQERQGKVDYSRAWFEHRDPHTHPHQHTQHKQDHETHSTFEAPRPVHLTDEEAGFDAL